MYFKQFLDERCGCASYLVASRQSHEAAIIDPSLAIEEYETLLAQRGFRLRYVIDTHIHADHVSGARRLAAKHGGEVCLHEAAQVSYPFRPLHDGEELALGQLRLRVLHTPGHRPELISMLVVNPDAQPRAVDGAHRRLAAGRRRRAAGFRRGRCSRPIRKSQRLLRLPDWVAVFPGHFEGPCGKGMCGRPSTTIGFERLFNPLARLERVPFIDHLSEAVPARPLNITAIEATNRGLADHPWAMLASNPAVDEMSLEELESRDPRRDSARCARAGRVRVGPCARRRQPPASRPGRSPRRAAPRSPRGADLPGGLSLAACRAIPQADRVHAGLQRPGWHGRLDRSRKATRPRRRRRPGHARDRDRVGPRGRQQGDLSAVEQMLSLRGWACPGRDC